MLELVKKLEQNNMKAYVAKDKTQALEIVKTLIPNGATVAVGGSMTLNECKVLDYLRNGDFNFLDRYKPDLTPDQVREIYCKSFSADVYLCSSNAITKKGELYNVDGNAEILFEYNLDFYRRLIPYAKEYGIKIAIENIGSALSPTVTSTPERLNRLFDTLNDKVFTICFDVGHCLLQNVDPGEAIRAIGDRLVDGCTHVHDNNGDRDSHTLPFYGNVEWESVMKALADIGYRGDLNYEASGFLKKVPAELYVDGLKYMAKVGHYLVDRFEYYKNNK